MPFNNGEHPRLYFSQEELPALREAAKTGPRAELLNTLCWWCEKFLDTGDEHYFDFRERGRPIWQLRDVCHTWQRAIHMFAFAYAFTGNKRFGHAAREVLLNAIETRLADEPFNGEGCNSGYEGWRRSTLHQHDKGNYAWAVCHVYDLCHDLLSEVERVRIRDHIVEGIHILDDPFLYHNTRQFLTNNRGSRAMMGVRGVYPLTIEGEVDLPNIEDYLDEALNAAQTFLVASFDQDGVPYEGASYGVGSATPLYLFAKMLARSGRINLLRNPLWERILHYQLYELLPNSCSINNLNDCDSPNGSVAASLFLLGSSSGAILPWLAQQLDLHPVRRQALISNIDAAHALISPVFLWEWRDGVEMCTPHQLQYPTSYCFMQRGIASMRTGWDKLDTLVSHKCGYEMDNQHTQSDQNHVALYALGEHFLVDEGYNDQADIVAETGYGEKNYRYFSRADLHNTVIFDGLDQNGNSAHGGWPLQADGRIIDWQSTPDFDTSLGDAKRAYGKHGAIKKALRRVMFVRDTPHPYVIVIDAMEIDDEKTEHIYEVLWRTAGSNTITVDKNEFTIAGVKNSCYGVVLYPTSAGLSVKRHYNLPQLRVRVCARVLEMVTVFSPLQGNESPPSFTCERNDDGDFTITVQDGDKQHVIRAGASTTGPLHKPILVEYQNEFLSH